MKLLRTILGGIHGRFDGSLIVTPIHSGRTSARWTVASSLALLLAAWPVAVEGGSESTCTGDCSANGTVGVDELVLAVDIGLGGSLLEECSSLDCDGDGTATVDEIILAVNNALSGCPALSTPTPTATSATPSRTPTVLSGLIEAESFLLPAGELAVVTGDLTIRTTGAVRIDGDLIATEGGRQNIFIDSGGDVGIGGTIAAGNGALVDASGKGARAPRGIVLLNAAGNVVVQSAGNVSLGTLGRLVAGDGTNGGDGGDVVVNAPNGVITIPNRSDVMHIGNGGDGNAIFEDPTDGGEDEDLDNFGGDSGLLLLNATSVTGVAVETVALNEAYSPAGTDLVFPLGAEVFTTGSTTLLSGGRGGNAGSFDFGSAQTASGLGIGAGFLPRGGVSIGSIVRRGAHGGDGFLFGGAGADVSLFATSGAAPGADGEAATSIGGNGGGCLGTYDRIFCVPGSGGDAEAFGGDGADGAEPGGNGGNGGDAVAMGGNSAANRENPDQSTIFGQGGDADASAGFGGFGGDDCPSSSTQGRGANRVGGDGGDGGDAAALGGNAFEVVTDELRGFSFAGGGFGGDGGDGEDGGGSGGNAGNGTFLREADVLRMGSEAADGLAGFGGGFCEPPTPTPTVGVPLPTPTHTPTRTHTPTVTPTRTPTSSPTSTPTMTPTSTRTPSGTTTPTASPTATNTPVVPAGPIRVKIVSGTLIDGQPITSFFAPLLGPFGFVVVQVRVGTSPSSSTSVVVRCPDGKQEPDDPIEGPRRDPRGPAQPFQILAQQGKNIPNSKAVIQNISDVISSADGDFALLSTDMGSSLVQLTDDAQIVPILGVGAPDTLEDLRPRDYVVGGGSIVAVSQIEADMEIVAVEIDDPDNSTSILSTGDMFAGGTVTEVIALNPVYLNNERVGTARIEIDDSPDIIISYDMAGVPSAVLADGDPAPSFAAGINISRINSSARINSAGFMGLRVSIFGVGINNNTNDVGYVLGSNGQPVAVIQEGTQVPGAPADTVFNFPSEPILGSTGAAFLNVQGPPGSSSPAFPRAVGFIDLAGSYRTLALAGTAAPGGGTFADFLGPSVAMNDAGRLVFRATLQEGGSAYYVVQAEDTQSNPQRVIGSGDVVPLPGGESAAITAVGSFSATGGQSGDATPLNDSQLTLTVGLDNGQNAVVVVDLPE